MKFLSLKIGLRKDRYLYIDPHMTFMLFLFMLLVMLAIALVKESVMKPYFFSDQTTIFSFMKSTYSFEPGDSYGSTAYFYKLLGFAQSSIVFALLSAVIIISTFVFIFIQVRGASMNIFDIGVFLFFCFSSMINLTWQSKDFIVFLIMLPLLITFLNRTSGLLIWTCFALFYACYFRTYWFLLLLEFYSLLLMSRYVYKGKWIFVLCLFSLLVLAFGFRYGLGIDVDNFRNEVNEHRLEYTGDGSNTLIRPWFPAGNPLFGWMNVSLTWITFFVPFPLILMLSPYYMVISTFIILMFRRIWQTLHAALRDRTYPLVVLFSLMIISYTVIQSLFEPDYGSYLRHLAPFLSINVLCLFVFWKV